MKNSIFLFFDNFLDNERKLIKLINEGNYETGGESRGLAACGGDTKEHRSRKTPAAPFSLMIV